MIPVHDTHDLVLWQGDCRQVLSSLPESSVQAIVTSPPYFGLRDYGTGSWEEPVAKLNDEGKVIIPLTLKHWTNCDHAAARVKTRYDYSLANSPIQDGSRTGTDAQQAMFKEVCPDCGARRVDDQIGLEPTPNDFIDALLEVFDAARHCLRDDATVWVNLGDKYLDGELAMIPERFAIAMTDECGWFLFNKVVWCKPNGMPESATRRFTKAHELILCFGKTRDYKFIQQFEDAKIDRYVTWVQKGENSIQPRAGERWPNGEKKNMRDWWAIPPASYPDAHFAVFPDEIPTRAIMAGSNAGDWILDPFMGTGTTARVARALERRCVGIELNPDYCEQIVSNNQQQTLWGAA